MKRTGLAICCVLVSASLSACGKTTSAPLMPDGTRLENGGSLGGGGRGTKMTDDTFAVAAFNGGSLGGGGR